MSRALNVSASEQEVRQICAGLDIAISSIEQLVPTGMRIVCLNAAGSAVLRKSMAKQVIDGQVTRMPRALRTAFRT